MAYGAFCRVSNVPHGSVNSLTFGVGWVRTGEGVDFWAAVLTGASSGRTTITTATAVRITAPRMTKSQRTLRNLPP